MENVSNVVYVNLSDGYSSYFFSSSVSLSITLVYSVRRAKLSLKLLFHFMLITFRN